MAPSSKKSVIQVFVFFLALLLTWFTYSTVRFTQALKTKNWPSASGTVIASGVKKIASKGLRQYEPDIRYFYKVDTSEYQSDKYSITAARGTRQWADDLAQHYSANTGIMIFYNPEKPGHAVIKTGLEADNYYTLLISSFAFIAILLFFINQLKNKESQPQPSA